MLLELKNVDYYYNRGTPFEVKALDNINLKINEGEFIAIIGHTGSGKSTLIQQFNGLVFPDEGEVLVEGQSTKSEKADLTLVRQKIGLVFQYPEYQLFEDTIEKDISYGPRNLGLSEEEIAIRVKDSMQRVGLDYEIFKDKSPFDLSGGEKRRVAIAGILAMNPDVLVLDEPAAGLDPSGRDEIFDELTKIHKNLGITVIIVSHSMEDVARLVDRIIVMDHGKVAMDDIPMEIFKRDDELINMGLRAPVIRSFMKLLKSRGMDISDEIIVVEDAKIEIERYLDMRDKNA